MNKSSDLIPYLMCCEADRYYCFLSPGCPHTPFLLCVYIWPWGIQVEFKEPSFWSQTSLSYNPGFISCCDFKSLNFLNLCFLLYSVGTRASAFQNCAELSKILLSACSLLSLCTEELAITWEFSLKPLETHSLFINLFLPPSAPTLPREKVQSFEAPESLLRGFWTSADSVDPSVCSLRRKNNSSADNVTVGWCTVKWFSYHAKGEDHISPWLCLEVFSCLFRYPHQFFSTLSKVGKEQGLTPCLALIIYTSWNNQWFTFYFVIRMPARSILWIQDWLFMAF